jgi:putative hemolysin
MKTSIKALALTAFAATLAACATSPLSFAGGSSSAGVPAPGAAGLWCSNNGGKLVYFKNDGADFGVCELERALVEAATFYKATGSNGTTEATQAFIRHPAPAPTHGHHAGFMPNPASAYCVQNGGRLAMVYDDRQDESGFCVFSDDSSIEEWTLFRGPSDPGNAKLAHLLGVRQAE